jgi:hypothetical protein
MYDAGFRGSAWDTDNFENRENRSVDLSYQRSSPSTPARGARSARR